MEETATDILSLPQCCQSVPLWTTPSPRATLSGLFHNSLCREHAQNHVLICTDYWFNFVLIAGLMQHLTSQCLKSVPVKTQESDPWASWHCQCGFLWKVKSKLENLLSIYFPLAVSSLLHCAWLLVLDHVLSAWVVLAIFVQHSFKFLLKQFGPTTLNSIPGLLSLFSLQYLS